MTVNALQARPPLGLLSDFVTSGTGGERNTIDLKAQGSPTYIEDVTRDEEEEAMFTEGGEKDELYDQAVSIVLRDRKASTSYVQRCLRIGYNRAASIIDQMEREGLVGPANHVGKREVLAREDS